MSFVKIYFNVHLFQEVKKSILKYAFIIYFKIAQWFTIFVLSISFIFMSKHIKLIFLFIFIGSKCFCWLIKITFSYIAKSLKTRIGQMVPLYVHQAYKKWTTGSRRTRHVCYLLESGSTLRIMRLASIFSEKWFHYGSTLRTRGVWRALIPLCVHQAYKICLHGFVVPIHKKAPYPQGALVPPLPCSQF